MSVLHAREDKECSEKTEVRDRWCAWVNERLLPQAASIDQHGITPRSLLAEIGSIGGFSVGLGEVEGEEFGSLRDMAIVHEEVGRGSAAVRSFLTVHCMLLQAVCRWGRLPVGDNRLHDLLKGTSLGGLAFSEMGIGSDLAGVKATASRTASGRYELCGIKRWVTGGQVLDSALVLAVADGGPTVFLVDCHSTGVRREALCDVIGARGSMMADIHFEDVTVGDDAIIGGEGMGLAIATGILDYGRLSVAAGSVGIVQACLDCSVDYAWPCSKDGRQIGDFQLIQELISKMSVAASAGRALVAEAALSKELGLSSTLLKTCIAKQFAATSAVQAANDAVQLHGAAGLTTRYPVERLLRDAKVMEIIEGSTQIQHGIIAEATRDALRQVGGVR